MIFLHPFSSHLLHVLAHALGQWWRAYRKHAAASGFLPLKAVKSLPITVVRTQDFFCPVLLQKLKWDPMF